MTIKSRRELLINAGTFATLTLCPCAFSTIANAAQSGTLQSLQDFFERGNGSSIGGVNLRHKGPVYAIYRRRNFQPLWSEYGEPTFTSKAVQKKLGEAHLAGLQPSKYFSRLLHQLAATATPDRLVQYDLVMTDSLYTYFDDIAHGNLRQRSASPDWKLQASRVDVEAIASEFFSGNYSFQQTLRQLEPGHSRYHGLLNSLSEHLNMSTRGHWTRVPNGGALQLGDNSSRVALLKQRLLESGDLHFANFSDSRAFDVATTKALIEFQQRHGLDADGVLGPITLRELNVSLADRIAQIEVNLDRWRWLARSNGQPNIVVNLPGYDMELNINDQSVLDMKVVIGKTSKRTPLFSDVMEYMVVKPSWYVPKSIARDIALKERNKPGYLDRNNFEITSTRNNQTVSASSLAPADTIPENFVSNFRLRQRPGDNNALGNIKFMFPNKYNIYLHDTNAKGLFAKFRRAFSHGCIRLEKPFDLATALLQSDGRSRAEIESYFAANSTKKIHLRASVPVHLSYQTAWFDQQGRTHFRADIYNHDTGTQKKLKRVNAVYANAEGKSLARTGIKVVSNSY